MEDVKKCLTVLNNVLLTKTFLVGERVTLADISVGCNLLMLYRQVCDKRSDVLLLCCVRLCTCQSVGALLAFSCVVFIGFTDFLILQLGFIILLISLPCILVSLIPFQKLMNVK